MLIDRSARVWAMRRDDVMNVQALEFRAAVVAGEQPAAAGPGQLLEGSYFARVIDGAAVIPVRGPLMRTFSYWAWSYEELRRDIDLALAEPSVKSIILDIDSPGGLVAGCDDCAAFIRGVTEKPITAFVGGLGTSAAYWLAAATSEIHLGSGALVGSIGSLIEYVDFEPMFEKMGARMIRVVAEQSPNKRLDPESAEGKAEMQAIVNASGAAFVTAVAGFRGVSEAVVMDQFGQGLVFPGDEAIRRGMADGNATLEEIIVGLAGRDANVNAAPAAVAKETPMDWANLTLAALREHRPDLVGDVESAATTAATTAATATASAAERARILGLDEIAVAGHEGLVAAAKADGKTTPAELALQIVRADKASGTNHLAQRAAADGAAAVPAAIPPAAAGTTPKAKWDADANLQAEFDGDFAAYEAWEKASASGLARVQHRAS